MPALRGPLREGRVSLCVPRPLLPVRLRLRGARPHLHGLYAEGVRGGDRRRHASRSGAAARRLRGGAGDAAAAADVPLRGRPVLRAPRRGARLRQPRVQRAAGGIADVLSLRATDVASGTFRSASTPRSGPSAASAKATRHELAPTIAANAGGTQAADTPSNVC